MTFKEEFPSIKGRVPSYVREHCVDKQRVREAIDMVQTYDMVGNDDPDDSTEQFAEAGITGRYISKDELLKELGL